jgi:23S rRNA pseudouridine1911/1915/1917 synthase
MKNTLKTLIVALSSPVSSLVTPTNLKRLGGQFFLHVDMIDGPTVALSAAENGFTSSSYSSSKGPKRKNQTKVSPSLMKKEQTQRSTDKATNKKQTRRFAPTTAAATNSKGKALLEPTIIFSNNHLLVVNKPAGYHSQPNESMEQEPSKKCLLSKLKKDELGGGSAKNFLLPMHRLDQPCTGVLLLAKTSKAGTRTGNAFRLHAVQKDYFCVVEGDLDDMIQRSEEVIIPENGNGRKMYKLSGVYHSSFNKGSGGAKQSNVGASVMFKPLHTYDQRNLGDKRVCHLEWEHLVTVSKGIHLVRVITGTGAKHQVRAMLSQLANSPVCGDLRYGASAPLPDMSVALHARSLFLPTVSLGDMNMQELRFIAPIPKTWSEYFSMKETNIPVVTYGV